MLEVAFDAEIVSVNAKKTVSNDKQIDIKLITNDLKAIELASFSENSIVRVTIKEDER